jgi:hypothetical protein
MQPKTIIVTIHGQESKGKKMFALSERLQKDLKRECKFINLRYTRLLTIVNTLPWVRTMTAKYIAARLDTIDSDYPNCRIICIGHSNGTVGISKAMDMRYARKGWPQFAVDGLILLGCPMKRNYDWGKHPHTEVINFVSKNDKVVFMAMFYGMGSAGRYSFKKKRPNLKQVCVKWGHSGFMEQYRKIKCYVELLMEEAGDGGKKESKGA